MSINVAYDDCLDRGLAASVEQRPAAALATWQPLFALCASLPLGHFARGFAALVEDDQAAALRHFRRGLALSRDEVAAALGVGTVVEALEHHLGDASLPAGLPGHSGPGGTRLQ